MFSTKILRAEITDVTTGTHLVRHDDIVGERITETRDGYGQMVGRTSSFITESRTNRHDIDVAWVEVDGIPYDTFRMFLSPRPGEEVYVFEHSLAGRRSIDLFHRRTARIIFHGGNPYKVGSRKPLLILAALIFVASYLYWHRPMIALGAAIGVFLVGAALTYLRFFVAKVILGTMRIRARRKVLYGG